MMNIRILDRYIIIKYIVTFLTMLVLFIPISVLVDLSQKIDNFNQYEVPTSDILWYYYNFIWHFGFILFPIFLFLSVIWFTSKLSSNTEVIAMLGSGISFNRYLRPFLVSALIISMGAFVAGQFIVPTASKNIKEFEFNYFKSSKKNRETQQLMVLHPTQFQRRYGLTGNRTQWLNTHHHRFIAQFDFKRFKTGILPECCFFLFSGI